MKKKWLVLFVIMTFTIIYFSCKNSGTTDLVGNWTKRTPFPGISRTDAVCFTISDTAYVGLGYNANGPSKSPYPDKQRPLDFYKYNADKDYWTQVADFPGMGRQGAVGFSIGNKGYVGTGYSYDGNNFVYLGDFFQYDQPTNSWSKKKTFPKPRRDAIGFGIGTNGYIGMGYDDNYLGDMWRYTPDADSGTWSSITSRGEKRQSGVVFVLGQSAYICGGNDNGVNNYDFWKFTPSAGDDWTQLRDIANTNSDESYDDDYINIVGSNEASFASEQLNKGYIVNTGTVWEYDPTRDQWIQKTSFEGNPRRDAVGFSVKNRLYLTTGASGTYFDDLWEFKPYEEYDAYH